MMNIKAFYLAGVLIQRNNKMNDKPSLLVVGSINMDFFIYGVPRIARYGETLFCDGYASAPGGKGGNQAVAAARMGGDVHMVACVGDDKNGKALLDNLVKFGVGVQDIAVKPGVQTGFANILVDGDSGSYTCYAVLGGNGRITVAQVKQALARRSYKMIMMQLEMPLEVIYGTCELASEMGIPIFLDAGPAIDIDLERLRGIFIISPNEAETLAFTGIDPDSEQNLVKAATILYEKVNPSYVLLKLGERGAYLFDGKQAKLMPCFPLSQAIDTTAAGDTFGGAFAVRYCKGDNICDAIRYAHVAAGICVSKKGAQDSIPSAKEVNEKFMFADKDKE